MISTALPGSRQGDRARAILACQYINDPDMQFAEWWEKYGEKLQASGESAEALAAKAWEAAQKAIRPPQLYHDYRITAARFFQGDPQK